jgi:1,4-alpha-glucan branching enzyme
MTAPAAARGQVELALFAPYNETVELKADFTGWEPRPMVRGDGWWRQLVALDDGDYRYKFRVKSLSYFARGELVEVFDPYALEVTGDEDENSVLRVRGGERTWTQHQWRHDDVPLPQNQDLVIYELFVGDFAGGTERRGRFEDVTARLDELRDLGVNCIELMPVKFSPGKGWGYNLRSLFAVAAEYGTPDDLCRLVDECHGRGMRVVVDGVYNHADAESPLTRIDYGYWYHEQNPDPPEMQWGPKFDYGHFDEKLKLFPARKYVVDSIKFWVEKFRIDGIRFDATRAIGNFDTLRELASAGFERAGGRKPFLTVAEHVPEDPAITGFPDGPMVAAWRFSLGGHFRAVLTERADDGESPDDFEGLLASIDPARNGYLTGGRCVNYIVSHDHDRLMQLLGDKGGMFDDVAFARAKLGLGLLATIPGVPMMWMGQEFGAASEKSLDPRSLDWSLLKNARNSDLRDRVRLLFQLRHRLAALRNDSFQVCLADSERRVFAFKRWTDDGSVVVVAVNLRHQPAGQVVVGGCGLPDGPWREHIFGYDRDVRQGVLGDELGPSEVKIFVKAP